MLHRAAAFCFAPRLPPFQVASVLVGLGYISGFIEKASDLIDQNQRL